MISGIFVSVLMLAFLGLVAWAWSSRRKLDFLIAASMPLRDEPSPEDAP
jgi:cytochrome c oxidase cbb3-type subunit IV